MQLTYLDRWIGKELNTDAANGQRLQYACPAAILIVRLRRTGVRYARRSCSGGIDQERLLEPR